MSRKDYLSNLCDAKPLNGSIYNYINYIYILHYMKGTRNRTAKQE